MSGSSRSASRYSISVSARRGITLRPLDWSVSTLISASAMESSTSSTLIGRDKGAEVSGSRFICNSLSYEYEQHHLCHKANRGYCDGSLIPLQIFVNRGPDLTKSQYP